MIVYFDENEITNYLIDFSINLDVNAIETLKTRQESNPPTRKRRKSKLSVDDILYSVIKK